MTENPERQIGERLAVLTRWRGERTELWQEALAATDRDDTPDQTLPHRWLTSPLWRVAAVFVVLASVAGTVWFLSTETSPRRYARALNTAASQQRASAARNDKGPSVTSGSGFGAAGGVSAVYGSDEMENYFTPEILSAPSVNLPDADRHVVRKATIELVSDDVPLVFVKCRQLISEAHGEFIEASTLTGSGATARGSLTLRIAVERLSDVLNDLRRLARVRAEETHGEDVTAQVVDLEARLRNERRVEAELLDLLEKRTDAPLKDILEMRRQINIVRESIERLTAQSQQLDRLVSLASVLVIIRPVDAEEKETELGAYFSDALHASWTGGLRLLADTVSGGLRVAVGGLLWWLLLASIFVTVRHYLRKARTQHGARQASQYPAG
ncbi:MAG: DUF4349 domain-containing protein [Phycisphaerales bacterium]